MWSINLYERPVQMGHIIFYLNEALLSWHLALSSPMLEIEQTTFVPGRYLQRNKIQDTDTVNSKVKFISLSKLACEHNPLMASTPCRLKVWQHDHTKCNYL